MVRVKNISLKALSLALLVAASGCSSGPVKAVGGIFSGGDDKKKEGEAPAEENRISILTVDQKIEADPRFAGQPIEVAPAYKNVSWTQPGGEADHTLHHLSASLTFERAWTADIGKASGKRARITAPPVIAEGKLYVLDAEAKVTAFDSATGATLWERELAPELDEKKRLRDFMVRTKPSELGFGGGVAFDDNKVFVTSGFGFAAALNAETGEELWRTKTDSAVRTPPTAYRGAVYFVTNTNEAIALAQSDGKRRWGFQSFEESARILSAASPAAAGDLVVAPFSSGEVVAFMADNGRALWNDTLARNTTLTALSELNDIAGSPVIDRGLVYVVSHAGKLIAIDLRSGERAWEAPVASLQMPWVAGDFVYIVSVEGELVCLKRDDGAVMWVSQLERYKNEKKRKGRIAWSGPVLAGGSLILVSTQGDIVKASPQDGTFEEAAELGDGSIIPPIVADDMVYLLSDSGKLYAFR
jgi:outer membrane protein assembly factor BamB